MNEHEHMGSLMLGESWTHWAFILGFNLVLHPCLDTFISVSKYLEPAIKYKTKTYWYEAMKGRWDLN